MLNIFHSDIHMVTVGVNIVIKLLWLVFSFVFHKNTLEIIGVRAIPIGPPHGSVLGPE